MNSPQGTFWNDEYIPCPDGGGLYITVGICQNFQNCLLKRASLTICKSYLDELDFGKMILGVRGCRLRSDKTLSQSWKVLGGPGNINKSLIFKMQ